MDLETARGLERRRIDEKEYLATRAARVAALKGGEDQVALTPVQRAQYLSDRIQAIAKAQNPDYPYANRGVDTSGDFTVVTFPAAEGGKPIKLCLWAIYPDQPGYLTKDKLSDLWGLEASWEELPGFQSDMPGVYESPSPERVSMEELEAGRSDAINRLFDIELSIMAAEELLGVQPAAPDLVSIANR